MRLLCTCCGNEFESDAFVLCYVCLSETVILNEYENTESKEIENNYDWILEEF
jgi:hypothetical protein